SDEPKSRKRVLQSYDSDVSDDYPVLSGSPVLNSEQSQIPDFEVIPYKFGQQIDVNEEIPAYLGDLHLEEDINLEDLKDLEDQESSSQLINQDNEEQFPMLDPISTSVLSTTPSTDVLLSLAVAPEL
ncbi:MAG: hypothetical protein PV354_10275, partial [Bartonella sp.]|nr:hypothetical protein [Bartonella sp.]